MCNLYRLNARRSEIAVYLRANDGVLGLICAYPSQLCR